MGLLFAFMPVLAGNNGPDKASRLEVLQLLIRCALPYITADAKASCALHCMCRQVCTSWRQTCLKPCIMQQLLWPLSRRYYQHLLAPDH